MPSGRRDLPRENTLRFVTDVSPRANDHPAGKSGNQSSAAPRRRQRSWTVAPGGAEKSHVPLVVTDAALNSGAGAGVAPIISIGGDAH